MNAAVAARAVLMVAAVLLPVVIAFAGGGTTDTARAGFLAAACLVAAGAAATALRPWPAGRAARTVLAALAAFALLTGASHAWTSDPGGWLIQTELAGSYLALAYAATVLTGADPRLGRLAPPVAAAGTVLVSGYALLARLLSDLVGAAQPARSGGRLSAPLGYWNAEGALAALGLVICVALAADRTRSRPVRAAAVAATAPLAIAVQLSYSRGALVAATVGVLVVAARSSSRAALGRAAVCAGGTMIAAVLVTLPFAAARRGPVPAADGWPLLLLLIAVAALGFIAAWRLLAHRTERDDPLPLRARRLLPLVAALLTAGLIVTAVTGGTDNGRAGFGASGERLTQLGSNRAEYWRVAAGQLESRPLAGHGAGSFADAWLRERTIDENVVNAHSLWLETGAELGSAGLLLLLIAAGTVVTARRSPATAAIGTVAAYATAASVDWHWQIPALTGIAIVQLGVLLGSSDQPAVRGAAPSNAG